jgi:hypothetical protein
MEMEEKILRALKGQYPMFNGEVKNKTNIYFSFWGFEELVKKALSTLLLGYHKELAAKEDPVEAFVGNETKKFYLIYKRDTLSDFRYRYVFFVPKDIIHNIDIILKKIDRLFFELSKAEEEMDCFLREIRSFKDYKRIRRIISLLKRGNIKKAIKEYTYLLEDKNTIFHKLKNHTIYKANHIKITTTRDLVTPFLIKEAESFIFSCVKGKEDLIRQIELLLNLEKMLFFFYYELG